VGRGLKEINYFLANGTLVPRLVRERFQEERRALVNADAVVLVDDMDAKGGPNLVGTLIVNAEGVNVDARRGNLAPLLRKTTDLSRYARCDLATGNKVADLSDSRVICEPLGK
jgi:hypothetical protein